MRAAVIVVFVAIAMGVATLPVRAAKRGAPILKARALLIEDAESPEVRVAFELRNAGPGKLRACVGRAWGWRFPTADDPGSRVLAPPRNLAFDLAPGKVYRWNERLTYAGPQAWIESVVFWVELAGPNCKGKAFTRIEAPPVMLADDVPKAR